jgi:hypothetical protein
MIYWARSGDVGPIAARNPRPVTVRKTRDEAWSPRAAADGSSAQFPLPPAGLPGRRWGEASGAPHRAATRAEPPPATERP